MSRNQYVRKGGAIFLLLLFNAVYNQVIGQNAFYYYNSSRIDLPISSKKFFAYFDKNDWSESLLRQTFLFDGDVVEVSEFELAGSVVFQEDDFSSNISFLREVKGVNGVEYVVEIAGKSTPVTNLFYLQIKNPEDSLDFCGAL